MQLLIQPKENVPGVDAYKFYLHNFIETASIERVQAANQNYYVIREMK